MKQRITIDQINELSSKQKERFREWSAVKFGVVYNEDAASFIYRSDNDVFMINVNGEFYPLLSIGQMIELLSDYLPETEEYQVMIWKNPKLGGHNERYLDWNVEYFKDINRSEHGSHGFPELCDSLWEAVKKVL